ncbi:MAG: hypothetical protein ACXW1S_01545 [Acidimicrobiia bacterium]
MARSKNRLHKFEDKSVTADAIIAHRRRVTKADLRSKLREIGAYAGDTDDAIVALAEISVEGAVVENAEHEAQRDLGPLGVLLKAVPEAQLAIALGFATVIIVYKLGELMTRPRGPQVEVRKLTFPPRT